jgi:hypothetical protein
MYISQYVEILTYAESHRPIKVEIAKRGLPTLLRPSR